MDTKEEIAAKKKDYYIHNKKKIAAKQKDYDRDNKKKNKKLHKKPCFSNC